MKDGYDSLVNLPGVGISMADALYEKGFFSDEELSIATVEDLIQIRGIGEEKALKLIEVAKDAIEAMEIAEELPADVSLADEPADMDAANEPDDADEKLVTESSELENITADANEQDPVPTPSETEEADESENIDFHVESEDDPE